MSEPNAVNKYFSIWSCDKVYKMVATKDRHCKMHKKPFLLNHSTDFHKICCKMFTNPKSFVQCESKSLCALPFKMTIQVVQTLQINNHKTKSGALI